MQTQLKGHKLAAHPTVAWWRTSFGEEVVQSVSEAIRRECMSLGPITEEFEQKMAKALDVPYCVATTSGSTAILTALMALGIKEGDEVVVPNRTWIATAHAPMMLGAKVVLTDVLPDVPVMDVSQLASKITPRTKAIIPVPLNGRAVHMEEVWKIAKKHGLYVVEDAAQGLFSKYSKGYMGTASDIGCFSMSTAKLIPTGQGGFVVTRDKNIYEKLKRIRLHGVDDIIHCTFHQPGFNFRFTDLQASIGLVLLTRVEKRVAQFKAVYLKYEDGLQDLPFLKWIPVDIANGEIPLYAEVLCPKRQELIDFLAARHIQSRPFYPCLNTAKYLNVAGSFHNAEVFAEQGLILPCGPDQPLENIDYVLTVLKDFGREVA